MPKIIQFKKLLVSYKKISLMLSFFLTFIFISANLSAEQKVVQGDFQVHYSVFPSTAISAKVAAIYGIKRSKNRALLNITPQRIIASNKGNNTSEPVIDKEVTGIKATLKGTARNLIGNTKTLSFREVIEGGVVYYLAEFSYSNEEHFRFDIDVTPISENAKSIKLKFDKKFKNR